MFEAKKHERIMNVARTICCLYFKPKNIADGNTNPMRDMDTAPTKLHNMLKFPECEKKTKCSGNREAANH
jgi:hypothetical protein